MSRWRTVLQIIFFIFFVFLLITGRMQMWMILTLVAILAATLVGRFYCGFACPMFTATRPGEEWEKRKKRKSIATPLWAGSTYFRPLPVIILLAVIVMTAALNVEFPFFIVLILLAAMISIYFVASFWHRYLCPFGILFSLTSRFSRAKLVVDKGRCNSCGLCDKNCPGEAIYIDEHKKRSIEPEHCLHCFVCQEVCRQKAISFQWSKGKPNEQQLSEDKNPKESEYNPPFFTID